MTFHSVGNSNPNWRTHIFQRGRSTTNQKWWLNMYFNGQKGKYFQWQQQYSVFSFFPHGIHVIFFITPHNFSNIFHKMMCFRSYPTSDARRRIWVGKKKNPTSLFRSSERTRQVTAPAGYISPRWRRREGIFSSERWRCGVDAQSSPAIMSIGISGP